MRADHKELTENIKKKSPTKAERKEMKARGIRLHDRKAVEAYFAEKAVAAEEAKKAAELEAAEKAAQERLANPTAEDLLKEIRDLLKKEA